MLDSSHPVSRLTVVIHSRINLELWHTHMICASSLQDTKYHSHFEQNGEGMGRCSGGHLPALR